MSTAPATTDPAAAGAATDPPEQILDGRQAFLEESMAFVEERFAAMTPEERVDAVARLKASNATDSTTIFPTSLYVVRHGHGDSEGYWFEGFADLKDAVSSGINGEGEEPVLVAQYSGGTAIPWDLAPRLAYS